MTFQSLLQVLARPWLMEISQAIYYADIAHQILFTKTLDAIPGGTDPRRFSGAFYRVDNAGNVMVNGPVQVIQMKGPLMEEDYCGTPGMMSMQAAIKAANNDASVQSIVLWIDSPGGTVSGTHNLAREIKSSKKPIVSFVNKIMASAAYWIGSSAREIIVDDETEGFNSTIGSIGTKAVIVDRSGEMKQKGIKVVTIAADESSRKGKAYEDVLAGDYKRIKEDLNQINSIFLKSVKENRAGKLTNGKENVLDGETYNAKEALKHGLIDKIANFKYAVQRSVQLAKTITASSATVAANAAVAPVASPVVKNDSSKYLTTIDKNYGAIGIGIDVKTEESSNKKYQTSFDNHAKTGV